MNQVSGSSFLRFRIYVFLQLVKHVEVKEINQSSVTSSFTLDEYLNYDAVC